MVLNVNVEDNLAILRNFGALLNDPRHFDAGRDIHDLLDQGVRKFVLEMANTREIGETALGLLMTMTRQIRQGGGEIVLAKLDKGVVQELTEMHMEDFWDFAKTIEEAKEMFFST